MGFGSKGKSSGFGGGGRSSASKGKSGGRKKHDIKNIGGVWEGKYGLSITISDYHGTLLFQDKNTGNIYKVNSLRVTDPYNDRKGLVNDISINLENEKQCEFIGSGDDE